MSQTTSTSDTTFGPASGNVWTRRGDALSLVRPPHVPRPVQFAADDHPIEIDVAATALIIIDMQNDFCHPEGWFGQKGIDVSPMRQPIPAIAALLDAWRAASGRVVWVNWGIRADRLNLPPTVLFKGKRTADGVGYAETSPLDHGQSVVQGSWGAQVVEELPVVAGDITVHKHRLSGFWDNELDSLLRQQGITTLLYAGVNTDRCVFSTLQDAAFIGYDNILLSDACSTASPDYVTQAIHFIVRQLHGFVATSAALTDALRKQA
ncbi:peroxyureidoacrylate/ureidoacrylate amidohydrolase RutB [Pigmentiphaga litoralis]|jgi:nicotinamidase-related amidase|uniref:cysteine hydrolase n=1 Tax=Pigmentiphaga litoralis TaxID=516702 RepID=UPI001678AB84|nr:cysteine hydrolase [Pigmentiphaga litoralis]GGX37262.1 peroxyureidoacrylate/ureidoacrylate amidohydrolase RutB [Pigmentiphaga litoralis]